MPAAAGTRPPELGRLEDLGLVAEPERALQGHRDRVRADVARDPAGRVGSVPRIPTWAKRSSRAGPAPSPRVRTGSSRDSSAAPRETRPACRARTQRGRSRAAGRGLSRGSSTARSRDARYVRPLPSTGRDEVPDLPCATSRVTVRSTTVDRPARRRSRLAGRFATPGRGWHVRCRLVRPAPAGARRWTSPRRPPRSRRAAVGQAHGQELVDAPGPGGLDPDERIDHREQLADPSRRTGGRRGSRA